RRPELRSGCRGAEPSAAPKPSVLALSRGLRPPTPAVAPATAPSTTDLTHVHLGTNLRPALLAGLARRRCVPTFGSPFMQKEQRVAKATFAAHRDTVAS